MYPPSLRSMARPSRAWARRRRAWRSHIVSLFASHPRSSFPGAAKESASFSLVLYATCGHKVEWGYISFKDGIAPFCYDQGMPGNPIKKHSRKQRNTVYDRYAEYSIIQYLRRQFA